MSLGRTLLKVGALYAAGRLVGKVSMEDIGRLTGISGEDLRKYAAGRTDAVLENVGLQRKSTVPSATVMVLSGFAAGAIVGTGLTFLFYSPQGKEVRHKVAEYFTKEGDDETEAESEAAGEKATNGKDAKASATS